MLFGKFGRSASNESHSMKNATRRSTFESLEDRQLLAVTTYAAADYADYDEIAGFYRALENMDKTEPVIEITGEDLNEDTLRDLLDDRTERLIVLHSDEDITINLSDSFVVKGDLNFVSWGKGFVTFDGQGGRIMEVKSGYVGLAGFNFTNAYASKDGGAIHSLTNSLVVDRCDFYNNVSGTSGGAISTLSGLTIHACGFTGNQASDGGAISVGQGAVTPRRSIILNSLFYDNTVFGNSGATAISVNSKADIVNCTIADNYGGSAAVSYTCDGYHTIANTIFCDNFNAKGDEINVQKGEHAWKQHVECWNSITRQTNVWDEAHNLITDFDRTEIFNETDPRVSEWESFKYMLCDDSIAIDAGNSEVAESFGITNFNCFDYFYKDRFMFESIDIGADEWHEVAEEVKFAPRLIVNAEDDVLDHSDDFNMDGSPRHITLRDALDYAGKYFDADGFDRGDYATVYDAFISVGNKVSPEATYNENLEYVSGVYQTIYFAENVNSVKLDSTITVEKNCKIDGRAVNLEAASRTRVSVDGQDKTSLFFVKDHKVEFSNLTLENGFVGGETDAHGGALNVDFYATVVANDVVFQGNVASLYGGAVVNNGTFIVNDTSFIDNQAALGGAVYNAYLAVFCVNGVYNAGVFTPSQESERAVFSGNMAIARQNGADLLQFGSGGAIYNSTRGLAPGFVYINNASFSENSADKFGGAISDFGRTYLYNSDFDGNMAISGGAVQAAGSFYCTDAVFTGNVAKNTKGVFVNSAKTDLGGNGGAFYISKNASSNGNAAVVFGGTLQFTDNVAANAGGAIDNVSGGFYFTEMCSAEFVTNRAGILGGAIVFAAPFDETTMSAYSLDSFACAFDGNTAGSYSPTIAVASNFSEEDAQKLNNFFVNHQAYSPWPLLSAETVKSSLVETFVRYKHMGGLLRFEDLIVDLPSETTTIEVQVKGSKEWTALNVGETIELSKIGVQANGKMTRINYRAAQTPDVVFAVNVVKVADEADNNATLFAGQTRLTDRDYQLGAVQYSFKMDGLSQNAVSRWRINWGDGSETETVDHFGFALNPWHMYARSGKYDVSLSVTTIDGRNIDFGKVGTIAYQDKNVVAAATLDNETTDSLFAQLDWLEEEFI